MGDYGQYIVPTVDSMVNFKVGQPATTLLPLDLLRECALSKFAETDPMFLQYGHIQGYPKFRTALASFLTENYKASVNTEELFVTNGITGGLALIVSLFLQAGDLVFLEEPSYFLALSIMKDFNLNIRQIPMDTDGLNVDALEVLLRKGIVPKMLYCIPTCHNPTGRTMSIAKRKKLVQLSIEYGFFIIADEVYQLLSFPHVTPPPPMFTFDTHGTVFALGSFSKILAPALRIGWIQAHKKLLTPILSCGQLDSSGGVTPVVSGIVHAALTLGHQQRHLDATKQTLWERADCLMSALRKHLPPSTTFEVPDGGYFILVKLPEHLKASDLLELCTKSYKVQFLPGGSFATTMSNFLRLSFSWYNMEDLAEGAKRLGDAIRALEAISQPSTAAVDVSSKEASMLTVAVHGASGRLGQLIVTELAKNDTVTYAGAVQTRTDWQVPQAKVIIDVTLPTGTRALVERLLTCTSPLPLVIGTTGSDLPMELLRQYAERAPVVLTSNFSVGVPLMQKVVQKVITALPAEWTVGMLEVHHTAKKDAPSGTAKTLQASMVRTGARCLEKYDESEKLSCESLRLGDEIGQHTVYFAGNGERLEIKHQATRREVFALGALRAAEWIVKQPNGLYVQ